MADDWMQGRLGDVLELKRGYDLPARERQDGVVPIVSSGGVSGTHSEWKVRGPGVVTGRYGTLGQVFYVAEDFWPLNTTLYVCDFKGNDPRFISYFLRAIDFLAYSDKAAVPGLNRNHLHEARVRWPRLAIQQTIANLLSVLDEKIELNRRMNETLEDLTSALFKNWFVDFESAQTKSAGEHDGTPIGWRRDLLGNHVSLQRGTTYKSSLLGLPGPFLLGLASIEREGGFRRDKLKTYGGESADKLLLGAGDLFVSLKDVTQAGDLLGSVARVPRDVANGRLTQDTVKLTLSRTELSLGYVYWLLRSADYRSYCRERAIGTTNLSLSRDDFLSYPVLIPSGDLIDAFTVTDRMLSERQDSNEVESRTLAELRDGLLPRLLSGELRVRDAVSVVEELA